MTVAASRSAGAAVLVAAALTAAQVMPTTALAGPAEDAESDSEAPPPGSDPDEAPHADPEAERIRLAQEHYVEGKALFQEGRYLEAASEFERSYAGYPNDGTLYNLALAYEKGGAPVRAFRAWKRYEALGLELSADDSEELRDTIEKLRGKVGKLVLDVAEDVELEQVRIDGVSTPPDDFPVFVLPGDVTVELVGSEPGQRRKHKYAIDPGETVTIPVAFAGADVDQPRIEPPIERPEIPPELPPDKNRNAEILRATFWSGVAITAAGGVAIAVLGGLTRREQKRFAEEKCGNPCMDPESNPYPQSTKDRAEALQTATNVTIGVTAGIALATAIVGIFAFTRRPGRTQRAARPRVRVSGPGIVVRW